MAHGIIRTDLMAGTDVGTHLVSLQYYVNTTKTAIDNGNVVLVGDLINGEREVHKATAPAANSSLDAIAIVATPEVMYDQRYKNLRDFYNEAGKVIRGYRLHKHDIFSVTKDALDGAATPAVGNVVELKAGTKLNVVVSATNGSTVVGKIIAVDIVGKDTYYAIRVA